MNQEYSIINQVMEINNNYINREVMQRIKKYLVAPWLKYVVVIGVICELLLALYSFFHYSILYTLGFTWLVIIVGLFYPFLLNQTVKKSFLQRTKFLKNTFLNYDLVFDEEKIIYINNNNYSLLKYNHIKKVVQTEEEYIIISKFGRYIVCQKENMTKENIKQLIDLLKRYSISF